jgi:hypothetical protein
MTLKHIGFDDSEVMRELERLEAKKNPDDVWKPAPVKKQASFTPTDSFHSMIMLVSKLRESGRIKDADRLQIKIAAFQESSVHLYRAIDEDGDDLLEFAYPDGDVEVAPSQSDYGKVETPQSQHKKLIDIVNKKPTGKYASPEDLLSKISEDLGIKKKANKSLDVEEGAAYLQQFVNTFTRPMSFTLDKWGVIESTHLGKALWNNWTYSGADEPIKGEVYSLFVDKAKHKGFSVKQASIDFINGEKTFRQAFLPIVDAVNKALEEDYNGLVNAIKSLSPAIPNRLPHIKKAYNLLSAGKWYFNKLAGSQKNWHSQVDVALSLINKGISSLNNDVARFVISKIDKVINIIKTKYGDNDTAKKYIVEYVKTKNKIQSGSVSTQELFNLNKQLDDTIQVMSSVNFSLKKLAQLPSPEDLAKLKREPEAKPTPGVPAKKPVTTQRQGLAPRTFSAWKNNVERWKESEKKAGSTWYEQVIALQNLLNRFGSTEVLEIINKRLKKDGKETINVAEFGPAIRNTGWNRYGDIFTADGKWGPSTSRSILSVKKILESFGYDVNKLDVPTSGVLQKASTVKQKDYWGDLAKDIRGIIFGFGSKYGISGLGGTTPVSTDKEKLFDSLDPYLSDPDRPVDEEGDVPLYGKDLADLGSFERWLVTNRMVPTDETLSYSDLIKDWNDAVFGNLFKRAAYKIAQAKSAGDDEALDVAQSYRLAVQELYAKFRDAIAKWVNYKAKELGKTTIEVAKSIKVSLKDLAGYLTKTKPTDEVTRGKVGPEGAVIPVIDDDAKAAEYYPIGHKIYPKSWVSKGYHNLNVTDQIGSGINVPVQDILRRVIRFKDLHGDITRLKSVLINAGKLRPTLVEMLRFININPTSRVLGPNAKAGLLYKDIKPNNPEWYRIEAKFGAKLLYEIIGALINDISSVSEQYGVSPHYGSQNEEWADAISNNATQWRIKLERLRAMAYNAMNAAERGRSGQMYSRFW